MRSPAQGKAILNDQLGIAGGVGDERRILVMREVAYAKISEPARATSGAKSSNLAVR